MVTCAIHSAPIPAGGRPPHARVRRRQCHFAGVECSRALRACDSESVTFTEVIELVGEAIDGAGVAIIVAGVIAATIAAVSRLVRHEPGVYLRYRQQLGRSILLGLELLVAADIIRSIAIDPTLTSVAVLAGIVLVRTFLSFTLELEITGRWPWQKPQSQHL